MFQLLGRYSKNFLLQLIVNLTYCKLICESENRDLNSHLSHVHLGFLNTWGLGLGESILGERVISAEAVLLINRKFEW